MSAMCCVCAFDHHTNKPAALYCCCAGVARPPLSSSAVVCTTHVRAVQRQGEQGSNCIALCIIQVHVGALCAGWLRDGLLVETAVFQGWSSCVPCTPAAAGVMQGLQGLQVPGLHVG